MSSLPSGVMTARNTDPASSMTEPAKCQTSPCGLPRMLIVTASALTRFLRGGDALWRRVLSLAMISPSTSS